MRNWLFRETRNFAKHPVSFAKQRNSFRIEFRETTSETSFAGNPMLQYVGGWNTVCTLVAKPQPRSTICNVYGSTTAFTDICHFIPHRDGCHRNFPFRTHKDLLLAIFFKSP
jgi:hypothetical protein